MIKPSINQPFYKHESYLDITGFISSNQRSMSPTLDREPCYKSNWQKHYICSKLVALKAKANHLLNNRKCRVHKVQKEQNFHYIVIFPTG